MRMGFICGLTPFMNLASTQILLVSRYCRFGKAACINDSKRCLSTESLRRLYLSAMQMVKRPNARPTLMNPLLDRECPQDRIPM